MQNFQVPYIALALILFVSMISKKLVVLREFGEA